MGKVEVGLWAFIVGALAGMILTYGYATKGKDAQIEAIARRAADERLAFAVAVRAYEDSIAAITDSITRIEQTHRQIQTYIEEASGAVEATGKTLTEHLDVREDTAGLRLWQEHEEADAHLAELWQDERNVWQQQIEAHAGLEAQLRNIIASQDTRIVALEGNLSAMQSEAERWRLKAKPPFLIRLFKDGAQCGAASVTAWGLSKEPLVGIGSGLACYAVKKILP